MVCNMKNIFYSFTCEEDSARCTMENGVCVRHYTNKGKRKVDCLANHEARRWAGSSNKKAEFRCDVCDHPFTTQLTSVTAGTWCGQCSSKWKHCGEDECSFCHERSFGSYNGLTSTGKRKVDCLTNHVVRRWAISSSRKAEFRCDVGDHPFTTQLFSVTAGKWCSKCVNKTELKVYTFLESIYNIEGQYRPKKNYRGMIRCRFDIHIIDKGKIFEIDGPQHTEEVSDDWIKTKLFSRQIRDKWKEFVAKREGLTVHRFNQHAIFTDSYDWKSEMRRILEE